MLSVSVTDSTISRACIAETIEKYQATLPGSDDEDVDEESQSKNLDTMFDNIAKAVPTVLRGDLTISVQSQGGVAKTLQYHMFQWVAMTTKELSQRARKSHPKKIHIPWVGVAVEKPQRVATAAGWTPSPGHVSCFLPLPAQIRTMPLHINGTFDLSSNRRDIWVPTETEATPSKWNALLLCDGIAPLYAQLVDGMRKFWPADLIGTLFPHPSVANCGLTWKLFVKSVYQKLARFDVLKGYGCVDWFSATSAQVADDSLSETQQKQLANITGIKMVLLSKSALEGFRMAEQTLQIIKPSVVCSKLKRIQLADTTLESCIFMIKYCTGSYTNTRDTTQLDDLALLPLQTGTRTLR
eukprot:TRINITY_DN4827_c0_g1_i2.p1 TRINITY_DN4827_c0_g1~~TRINITY_DN4827_c0_g1_i2.p1  ORF type:complete len:354 (-),score=62.97 TRINITY_DN4827_c0_g1_i2:11-1072(-)